MTRRLDEMMRQRPEAFDAGDTPPARGLRAGYLDKVAPEHVKAALKAARKAVPAAEGREAPSDAEPAAVKGKQLPSKASARSNVKSRHKGAELRVEEAAAVQAAQAQKVYG